MKIMTILGTRPEIIRLSRIIQYLDGLCDHILIHTGQNFDASLSDVFFQQLGVRNPDRYLGIRGDTFGEQIGKIISQTERVMVDEATPIARCRQSLRNVSAFRSITWRPATVATTIACLRKLIVESSIIAAMC
jgi:hypothetical protein